MRFEIWVLCVCETPDNWEIVIFGARYDVHIGCLKVAAAWRWNVSWYFCRRLEWSRSRMARTVSFEERERTYSYGFQGYGQGKVNDK